MFQGLETSDSLWGKKQIKFSIGNSNLPEQLKKQPRIGTSELKDNTSKSLNNLKNQNNVKLFQKSVTVVAERHFNFVV